MAPDFSGLDVGAVDPATGVEVEAATGTWPDRLGYATVIETVNGASRFYRIFAYMPSLPIGTSGRALIKGWVVEFSGFATVDGNRVAIV